MKSIGKYNGFSLFEITNRDIAAFGVENSGYVLGDIIGFTPEEELPVLGYEEYVAGSRQEIKDFIDSYDIKTLKVVETKGKAFVSDQPMSEKEIHCGYDIILCVKVDDKNSYVIAENKKAPNPFVTWQCKTDLMTGGKDYFGGMYTNSYRSALENLCTGILTWTKNEERAKEDPDNVLEGIRNVDTKDVVISGMGNLTTKNLEKFQAELNLFYTESKANPACEPKDFIRDFLSAYRYPAASVTSFENDPSHLCATDILFNSQKGSLEHSDAWVVSTLNELAEKKCEFSITSDGVQMPPAANRVFNSSEARRAEQIVMGAYLSGQEQSLVNSTTNCALGR